MRELYASGGNYAIHVDDGLVDVRVWRRPDVAPAEGARFAREKVVHLEALARRDGVVGLLLNLAEAPPVVGPVTQAAVADMLRPFADRRHRIAVVVGESATQRLQMERLLRAVLRDDGCVVDTAPEAIAALRRR
jgi:hypothetical protein